MEVTDIIHRANEDESAKETTVTYVYCLDSEPVFPVSGIKHNELLSLKNVIGSEKRPFLKKRYFRKVKRALIRKRKRRKLSVVLMRLCRIFSKQVHGVLIKAYKARMLNALLDHLKQSSDIAYIVPELMLLVSSRLRKSRKFKSPLLLRALKCLSLNENVSGQKEISTYAQSLQTFLIKSLKFRNLKYLLKDLVADILSECCALTPTDELRSSAVKRLSKTFRKPKKRLDVVYGSTVGCLANMTIETGADVIPLAAFCNDKLAKRLINSSKLCNKLVCVCEPFIYCCILQRKDLSEALSLSLNETNSLYNLNVYSVSLYNLIRNAALHAPVSVVQYEDCISKPFNFSDLLFDEVRVRRLVSDVLAARSGRRIDRPRMSEAHASHFGRRIDRSCVSASFAKRKRDIISIDSDDDKQSSSDDDKQSSDTGRRIFWDDFDVFASFESEVIKEGRKILEKNDSSKYSGIFALETANTYCVYDEPLEFDESVFAVDKEDIANWSRKTSRRIEKKGKLSPF